MSLDISKLENVQELPGKTTARCPACDAAGHDRKGDHLVIFPTGQYGCVAYPGDAEHRKEIMRLVGDGKTTKLSRIAKRFKLRVHPDWKKWNREKDS